MGIYDNREMFHEELRWLINEAEEKDKKKDKEDIKDKIENYKKKPKEAEDGTTEVKKKEDKEVADDDHDPEVENPTIEVGGHYFCTIDLKERLVRIEDTLYDNKIEMTYDAFKKLVALYDKTDTRPAKKKYLPPEKAAKVAAQNAPDDRW